jgi:hypothetical protein
MRIKILNGSIAGAVTMLKNPQKVKKIADITYSI